MQIFLPDCYMGGHDRFSIVSHRKPFVKELWLAKIVSQRTKGKFKLKNTHTLPIVKAPSPVEMNEQLLLDHYYFFAPPL